MPNITLGSLNYRHVEQQQGSHRVNSNNDNTRDFVVLLQLITVKPVLRGHLWDKEKVAI